MYNIIESGGQYSKSYHMKISVFIKLLYLNSDIHTENIRSAYEYRMQYKPETLIIMPKLLSRGLIIGKGWC